MATISAGAMNAQVATKKAPFVRGHPVAGMLPALRDRPLQTMLELHERHGDIVNFRFFHERVWSVRDPRGVEQLLVTDRNVWQKKSSRTYEVLRELLGDGLVTSEGASWLKHRRLAQPAFHRDALARMATTMVDVAEWSAARFAKAAEEGVVVDVAREMLLLTQRIIGLTMLSLDLSGPTSSSLAGALEVALHFLEKRTNQPILLPMSWPLPSHTRFLTAKQALDDVIGAVIAERRALRARGEKPTAPDLLDMLMDATDEDTGEVLNDVELRDDVMTVFLAGHETTSNLLSWTWLLLHQNPQQQAAVASASSSVGARDRIDPSKLRTSPDAALIDRVLFESLRMMPPVWAVDRVAEADTVLLGCAVPKGAYAIVSPWVVHQHPGIWPEPKKFDPDRFLPDVEKQRPKYSFLPFLAGNRKCIGEQFALLEARVVLATLASRFVFTPVLPVVPEVAVTLRPRDGLPCTVRRR